MDEQTVTEAQQATADVLDYAEIEVGLDPIGSSDMLMDLSKFSILRCLEHGPAEPDVLWQEFKASNVWKKYYPDDMTEEEQREHYGKIIQRARRRWNDAMEQRRQNGSEIQES